MMTKQLMACVGIPLKMLGIAAMVLMLGLAGCEQEGPAEQAGEEIDEAVEKTTDELEEAADEMD